MKTEYISLTPLGAVALFLSGLMVGSVAVCGLPGLAVAIMGLFVVRQDAMDRITEGTYTRRWCVWRRDVKRSEPEVSA